MRARCRETPKLILAGHDSTSSDNTWEHSRQDLHHIRASLARTTAMHFAPKLRLPITLRCACGLRAYCFSPGWHARGRLQHATLPGLGRGLPERRPNVRSQWRAVASSAANVGGRVRSEELILSPPRERQATRDFARRVRRTLSPQAHHRRCVLHLRLHLVGVSMRWPRQHLSSVQDDGSSGRMMTSRSC